MAEQQNSPRVDLTRLQHLSRAYWQSGALFAAIELDIFTAISQGADTVAAVAKARQLSERQAGRLITVLTAMELLHKEGERYRNAPDVQRFLVSTEERFAGPWMLFTKPHWNEWGRLSEHLKSREEAQLGLYENFTVEDARKYHEATYSIGTGSARHFARTVDLSGRRHLLDLGGGSGAYSIMATKAFPGLKATVFDLPPVAVVAREFIAKNDAADRVEAVGGDFTRNEFPQGVDVVLMASNLPQYSAELIQLVVKKAFAALVPGGEMHLVGEALNDERTGPLDPAIWALNEAIWNSTGEAHSEAECREFFRKAGFVDVKSEPFIPGVLSRIFGRKPA
ncbi:MAG: methyltransferase [Reyranellaceae bacterium]